MRLPAHLARSCCSRLARSSHSSRVPACPTPSRLAATTPAHTLRLTAHSHSMPTSRTASTSAAPAPLIPFRTHTPAPTTAPSTPLTHVFWDDRTSTWTYLVVCPRTRRAAIIDSVLDFDPLTNTVSTEQADALVAFVEREHITVERILETHAHADHLTAAAYLQLRLSPEHGPRIPIGIHRGIRATQEHFSKLYDVPMSELEGAFDELYDEGDEIRVGECTGEVWHLPGHTECSGGYVWGEYVYTGDSVLLVRPFSTPGGSSPRCVLRPQLTQIPAQARHRFRPRRLSRGFRLAPVRLVAAPPRPPAALPPLQRPQLPRLARVRGRKPLLGDGRRAARAQQALQARHSRERVCQVEGGARQAAERTEAAAPVAPGARARTRSRALASWCALLWSSLTVKMSLAQVNIRAGRLPKNSQGKPFFRIPIHAPAVL